MAFIRAGQKLLYYKKRHDLMSKGWRLIFITSLFWSILWLIISILLWISLPYLNHWIPIIQNDVFTEIRHIFLALAIGLPGFIMTGTLGRRLFTLRYSHLLISMSLAGLTTAAVFCSLFFYNFGTLGLGIGISISQYLVAFLMLYKLMNISKYANTNSI